MQVVEAPGDDVEGVTELPCPPEPPPPPPNTQVDVALVAIEESVPATPTPLGDKEASGEESVESPEATLQPSLATLTEEDTRPKVFIHGEWRDSSALAQPLFWWGGLWDLCCSVSGFLTYELFCTSCGLQGTPEAQVPACCLGP